MKPHITAPMTILVTFFALLLCDAASAASIKQIVIAENSKTTEDTVLYIADIDIGDEWNEEVRDETLKRLVASGLFKDIDIYSEPHPNGTGIKVTILAQDKHSWVIAPAFYNQPTNKGFGVGFGENNLFGQNKKLLLYGQLATGDSFLVAAYIDPAIAGSAFHWAFDLYAKNERVIEYKIPTQFLESPTPVRQTKLRYLNAGGKVGFTLFRSLTLDARLRGAYVYYGKPVLRGRTPSDAGVMTAEEIPVPGVEGWDVSTELSLQYDRRSNWYGISSGDKYQVTLEKALPQLSSDFDYWKARASFVRARRFFERHNFIIKSSVGYGKDLPFQQEFTSGGTSLRGYKGSQFRGDLKLAFNMEYSVHLFSIPFPLMERLSVRGLAFADSRYTTFLNSSDDSVYRNYLPNTHDQGSTAPFKNAVGLGTRFLAKSIVLPLLGLDVGYALETGAVEIYFAIGLTD